MAELPQIAIQPQEFRAPIATVPENPIPEAARNTALIANKQIDDIGQILATQKQQIDDKKSLLDFYTGYNDLAQTVNTIVKPEERQSVHDTGLSDLVNRTQENYPDMSEIATAKLVEAASAKQKTFNFQQLKHQEMLNKQDVEAIVDNGMLVGGTSKDITERANIYSVTNHLLEQRRDQGLLSNLKLQYLQNKLQYGFRKMDALDILNHDPQKFLTMSDQELGLNPQDYSEYTFRAVKTLRDQDAQLVASKNRSKAQAVHDAWSGKMNQDQALEQWKLGNLTIPEYRHVVGGALPSDPQARSDMLDLINSHFDSANALEDAWLTKFHGNPNITDTDYVYGHGLFEERLRTLRRVEALTSEGIKEGGNLAEQDAKKAMKDDHAISSRESYDKAYHLILDTYGESLMNGLPSSHIISRKLNADLGTLNVQLRNSDIKDHPKLMEDFNKKIAKDAEGTGKFTIRGDSEINMDDILQKGQEFINTNP